MGMRRKHRAVAVLAFAGMCLTVATTAWANHTMCDNEPPPGDLWTSHNVSGVATVFAGVDTNLNDGDGWYIACVKQDTQDQEPIFHEKAVRVEDPNPDSVGYGLSVKDCTGNHPGTCQDILRTTGAEAGELGPEGEASLTGTCVFVDGSLCIVQKSGVRPTVIGDVSPVPGCTLDVGGCQVGAYRARIARATVWVVNPEDEPEVDEEVCASVGAQACGT